MAKRFTSSSVNWGIISDVISPKSKNAYNAFKAQYDKCLRDIAELPSEMPKIDWSSYKGKISAPGILDSYQKNYESLKIPYPSDQGWISKVEAQGQKKSAEFEKVRQDGLKQIAEYKKQLQELEKEVPFTQATLEELFLMRPEYSINPDKPKLWPQFLFENEKKESTEKH